MAYVTIADLRRWLSNLPDDTPLILSKDAEGNGYSPLAGVSLDMYAPETTWSGERYDEDEDPPDDAVRAVFLLPVN